ncbi:agmatinase family protein [Taibaiella chishuiensis]|uniref:Agmatinase n=1 Tax=Taibaiella chishuiensis TaxID=1434707 RepID=A0A2P8DB08_9BACT|nr:agmatinase family protein [Taibaiella chishuiensis]PSK94367.1 agmatinase [Taibaiella chishuiensis]
MSSALDNFDPNSPGLKSNNIFGLPFSEEESKLIIIPVPWEVTVSYRPGTSRGPEEVFDASMQVDLYDPDAVDAWKKGIHMLPIDKNIRAKSDYLRGCAELIIGCLSDGNPINCSNQLITKLAEVNEGGKMMHDWIHELSARYLKEGKKVALLGGDHSTPLGYIKALGGQYESFGILQIDAHADLREAYEGFRYSHASIMFNVLKEIPQVSKLVQVGIRDYCDEELEIITREKERVTTFFDKNIKEQLYEGKTWKDICDEIVTTLPQHVYISFDIDGLDPKLCPNTGTPVPGGFELEQVFYLFNKVRAAGKKIVGFDLNEISSGSHGQDCIDPIVGARALYKLCNYMLADA